MTNRTPNTGPEQPALEDLPVSRALCCECGQLRTVSKNYYPKGRISTSQVAFEGIRDVDDDESYWRFVYPLKCSNCGTKRNHAVLRDDKYADTEEADRVNSRPEINRECWEEEELRLATPPRCPAWCSTDHGIVHVGDDPGTLYHQSSPLRISADDGSAPVDVRLSQVTYDDAAPGPIQLELDTDGSGIDITIGVATALSAVLRTLVAEA